MNQNVTYSIGNLALIEKADDMLDGYLDRILSPIAGRVKDLPAKVKVLMYNRLGDCLPINHINDYPDELFYEAGCTKVPKDRSMNRVLERLGKGFGVVLQKHQEVLVEHDLVSDKQHVDFSSTYFEGAAEEVGEYGYSRDNQPNKKQITFGVSTGINSIPTALTIQRGNTQDKKHFRFMLRAAEAALPQSSMLIFDCGGNTKANKMMIRKRGYHYLTLKAKKVGPYKTAIRSFRMQPKQEFEMNGKLYQCVKRRRGDEIEYIYLSMDLLNDQVKAKQRRYEREKSRNAALAKKAKRGKPIGRYYCEEGIVIAKGILQTRLDETNPYINGVEGFFILESSVDTDPDWILALYKDRDKAEKLIRNIKEGTELRPIRHWNKWTIIGYVLLIFLTNFIVQLTQLRSESRFTTNVKRLKKKLTNLTLTVVYPPNGFRYRILANENDEIKAFLGDAIERFRDKSLPMRW